MANNAQREMSDKKNLVFSAATGFDFSTASPSRVDFVAVFIIINGSGQPCRFASHRSGKPVPGPCSSLTRITVLGRGTVGHGHLMPSVTVMVNIMMVVTP